MSKTCKMLFIMLVAIFSASISAHADVKKYGNPKGPVLVFLPGLSSHGDLWQPWFEQYKATHSIYVLTANGFAGQPAKPMETSFFADTTGEVIEQLRADGVRDAKLIGHSIGGLMSLMIAHDAPDLVSEVMVVDSLPRIAELMMPGMTDEQVKAQVKPMFDSMREMTDEAYKGQQQMALSSFSQNTEWLPTLGKWITDSNQMTVIQAFEEALTTDYKPNLLKISAPVIVLAAHNSYMPYEVEGLKTLYEEQYANLPNGTVKAVEKSYHFIMIDRPDYFTAELADFIAE